MSSPGPDRVEAALMLGLQLSCRGRALSVQLWPFAAEPKKLSGKAARRVLPVGTAMMRWTDLWQAANAIDGNILYFPTA